MMSQDGLPVGITLASEEEVIGVDTPESLEAVQRLYARIQGRGLNKSKNYEFC